MVTRRTFVGTLAGGLLAAPLAAEGQQAGKPARVGYLSTGERLSPRGEAFKQALREYGWVEGQNLVIEYRFGGEQYERLPPLAVDLVRLKVDVIFAASAPAAQAAKETTSAIPIVFHTLNDPVRAGLVASFARPGGNMTGNAGLGPELDRKRIELLKELVPSLTRATVLVNPANPMTPPRLAVIGETGRALGVEVLVVRASDSNGLDGALTAMARAKPAGLIVFEDPVFSLLRARIIEFARKQNSPSSTLSRNGPSRVDSSSTRPTSWRCFGKRPGTSTACFVAPSLPIFRWSSRRSSNWSLTSKPPRPSALRSRRRCCSERIR